jgi:hypothetical protein
MALVHEDMNVAFCYKTRRQVTDGFNEGLGSFLALRLVVFGTPELVDQRTDQ